MTPPCASTIHFEIASPRPVPGCSPVRERARSARQKRSNTLGRSPGAIPIPVSCTAMVTASGASTSRSVDASTGRRVLDRVGHQVHQQLPDAAAVDRQHHLVLGDLELDGHSALFAKDLRCFARFVKQSAKIRYRERQRRASFVGTREREQVGDQFAHLVDLAQRFVERRHDLARRVRVCERTFDTGASTISGVLSSCDASAVKRRSATKLNSTRPEHVVELLREARRAHPRRAERQADG